MTQAKKTCETPFMPQLTPSAPTAATPIPSAPPRMQCVLETVHAENLGPNGVCDARTDQNRAEKLTAACYEHSLLHGEGARGNRGGERVGDIVCTNVPGIEESEDEA